jgi:hypothetical protein
MNWLLQQWEALRTHFHQSRVLTWISIVVVVLFPVLFWAWVGGSLLGISGTPLMLSLAFASMAGVLAAALTVQYWAEHPMNKLAIWSAIICGIVFPFLTIIGESFFGAKAEAKTRNEAEGVLRQQAERGEATITLPEPPKDFLERCARSVEQEIATLYQTKRLQGTAAYELAIMPPTGATVAEFNPARDGDGKCLDFLLQTEDVRYFTMRLSQKGSGSVLPDSLPLEMSCLLTGGTWFKPFAVRFYTEPTCELLCLRWTEKPRPDVTFTVAAAWEKQPPRKVQVKVSHIPPNQSVILVEEGKLPTKIMVNDTPYVFRTDVTVFLMSDTGAPLPPGKGSLIVSLGDSARVAGGTTFSGSTDGVKNPGLGISHTFPESATAIVVVTPKK